MIAAATGHETHVTSRNLDEARAVVARAFCDHRLELQAESRNIDARIEIKPLSDITVVRIAYGASVLIDPGVIENFYLLRIVLSGQAKIETGDRSYDADPGTATLINPSQRTRILPSADCRSLLFRVNRARMEEYLCSRMQAPVREPLAFHPPVDLSSAGGARIGLFARYLLEDLDYMDPAGMEPHFSTAFEQVLMGMLLQFIPNNYSSVWEKIGPTISPRHIRRAIAFIETEFAGALTSQQIADAAGVSVRTLYNGFQSFHGETPMEFLRSVRLGKAHDLLTRGAGGITDIALQAGFTHLGRFAALYKSRYGCLPSETLRRAQ